MVRVVPSLLTQSLLYEMAYVLEKLDKLVDRKISVFCTNTEIMTMSKRLLAVHDHACTSTTKLRTEI